jgi:hypothetical protein
MCVGLVLGTLCASELAAQDYRAKMQGVVTDSSKAALPGATVTLSNDNTGVQTIRTSNESGHYIFDFVDPGTYTVSIEMPGFSKFVRKNVLVQVRGDVTVDAALTVGAVNETVEVTAATSALQMNTSTMEMTMDGKMLKDLPILARNPFTLALLNPAVVNRYFATRNPFFMWSSSMIDVGGNTSRQNDILLDGAPIQIGPKGSYSPPMDAVQEFSVQQNSVDAEFGHSAGGILSLGMKSGTNHWNGTTYYFGRNPALNAVTNPVTRTPNQIRNHIWGGTVGHPLIKNKLFGFTSYESWRTMEPRFTQRTMPTDLERTGDFSQSLNSFGDLRTIYDPWTTVFDPVTGRVTRTAFPGNRIPASRLDPTALRIMQDIWKPNNPGVGPTRTNNYQTSYSWPMKYWNFSQRIDWNASDRLKVFGRFSRVRTDLESENFAGSPAVENENGGIMNNRNIAADLVYVLTPNTVINVRGSYASLEDDYDGKDRKVGESGLGEFWPGNPWYKPYIGQMPAVYYPRMNIGGGGFGKSGYWYQHARHWAYSANMRQTRGIHNWKVGFENRVHHSDGTYPNLMNFSFPAALTADTFISPDTRRSGDEWATFLLGAIDGSSNAGTVPFQRLGVNFLAGFIHDDIRLSHRITLNLGLRYEYETAPRDLEEPQLSRYLDLSQPIPEMQNNPPQLPAEVTAIRTSAPTYTGAWLFTDRSNRGAFKTDKTVFMPRAGIAIRINDKTAFRAGYARYVVPPLIVGNTLAGLSMPYYSARTTVAPQREGIPQARLSDPFPAANPIVLPKGNSLGRYTNLGDNANWYTPNLRTGVNDRINFSLQRELPNSMNIDVTVFMNLGHDLPYTKLLNMSDPQLRYTHKAALNRQVANPFYQYMTPDTFPGPLRNQRTVSIGSLLGPYPQYGSLSETNVAGVLNRYYALQMKLERRFSAGYMFVTAYNYNREFNSEFFDDVDRYANRFTMIPGVSPRHRLTNGGTFDFPFGQGRRFLANAHPVANGLLGGWSTSWLFMFNSGQYLRFGQLKTDGSSPKLDNPTTDLWFDTSKFQQAEPFTPRTNPWQYPDVTGPSSWNVDMTLAKDFPIQRDYRLEFKLEAYNVTNNFVPSNPILNVLSPLFGKSTGQLLGNRGRELQYTLRLYF